MPYCDAFWHIDAHENILSPACLTVFVKSKTENQLIRFVIAYLVSDNDVKCETVAATRSCPEMRRPQTSLLQTYGLLTVLTLILWITGYVEYCSNVFIGNMLRLCSRSSTFRHVYHPTQHSYLLTFCKPPPLCR